MPSSVDAGTAYARSVVSGETLAGKAVRAACRRHLNDLARQRTDGFPWHWDEARGDRIVAWCGHLTLGQGEFEGVPWAVLPWQEFFLRSVFGWVDDGGLRRFRRAYLEVGKGGGKAAISSAMILYQLFAEGEAGAQIFCMGKTSKQARVVFDFARGMMERDPSLSLAGRVIGGTAAPRRLVFRDRYVELVTSSFAGKGHSGFMPSGIYIDELHEFDDRAQIELYERGTKHRREPLTLTTTNTGYGFGNVAHEAHQLAISVAEGRHEDERLLALVYGVDGEDDPFNDLECLVKANPSLPVIPGWEYLEGEAERTKGLPSQRTEFLRLNAGRWVDAVDCWLDVGAWDECETDVLPDAAGRVAVVGLDLASRGDLAGGVVAYDLPDGEVAVEAIGWVPGVGLRDRTLRDGAPYDVWVEKGHLVATQGQYIDFAAVAGWLREQMEREGGLLAVGSDGWGKREFIREADEAGLDLVDTRRYGDGFTAFVPHPQGFASPQGKPDYELWPAMPRSISATEELVLRRRLKVKRNPALRSAVLSAAPVRDGSGNRRLMKNKTTHRIDLAVAMVVAVGILCDWRLQRRAGFDSIEQMIL